MGTTEHQFTKDFRHTSYGRQQLAGFRLLWFVPALEAEFRDHLDQQARAAQRLGAVLLILTVGSFLYFERTLFVTSDPAWLEQLSWLRVIQLMPGFAVLVLTLFDRSCRIYANLVFPFMLLLLGVIAARIDIQYELSELPLSFRYGAGLLIIASFFFLGVTFWRALCCALSIIACDIIMARELLSPAQMPEHWIAVSYYCLLLVIGAVSRYVHEYSQREQFLMRGLLGWVAEHDALSGLANRRHYDAAVQRCLDQARRDRLPLTLLLLDLDDFKAYNDSLGHPAGDALIKLFSELLAGFARRPLDLAARVGGEEFALLLYDCDLTAAQQLAGQLLEALRQRGIAHPASAYGCASVSIGIATGGAEDSAEQLYRSADRALYRAKQAGKNRFAVSTPVNSAR